jgi:hypothetical protein
LDEKKHKAISLLFQHTDDEVLRKLRVSRDTLDDWKRDPEFAQALCEFVQENRLAAIRFISRRVVEAAQELESMIKSSDEKIRHKVIIDLLKASGLLAADHHAVDSDGEGVSAMLKRFSEVGDDPGEEN